MNKVFCKIKIIIILASFLAWPFCSLAYTGTVKETYPKLANYYLRWDIPNTKVDELAKWDVVVLDMEVQHNSLDNMRKLRQLNPNIILLAYITSEEVYYDRQDSLYGELRNKLLDQADSSWWLKDKSGNFVSFWGRTRMFNLTNGCGQSSSGERWNDFLPRFINDNVMSTGLWDGVFYDNLWPDVSWMNSGNLDINRDGKVEAKSTIDKAWLEGNKKMLDRTQQLFGGKYLVTANSRLAEAYQPYMNGIMLESFPAPWEAGGTWSGSMKTYADTKYFKNPYVGIINANTNNTWDETNYRKMRFSLGSTLLGNGSFSFDYGVNDHSQTWWYDEYETTLGKAVSAPVNILDKKNRTYKDGLWRRDFENGVVIVNSTAQNQNYVLTNEVLDKINGKQDRSVNNGARVNMVSVMGKDAVVLLGDLQSRIVPAAVPETSVTPIAPTPVVSTPTATISKAGIAIKDSTFKNGTFVRVFNSLGDQLQNGFFAYDSRYPGGAQIISTDLDNDKNYETLVNSNGTITIYRGDKILKSFKPFDGKFKGDISLAAADLDGDGKKEIVVGAGAGGGPQVRIFNKDGRLLNGGFFAYDRNFRGGVNVAAIDLNGDNTYEIITGSGKGGGPQVRIFNKDGKVLGGFFAYDKNSRTGVDVATGNLQDKQEKQIITAPGSGSSAQVRVWNKMGKLISQFSAYDQQMKTSITVSTADVNNNGTDEILAGSVSY
jgi:hypothetical protein